MIRQCCVCGAWIRQRDTLCRDCLDAYGHDRARWPEWLQFLANDTQREYNAMRRHREVGLDECSPDVGTDAVWDAWRYIYEEML